MRTYTKDEFNSVETRTLQTDLDRIANIRHDEVSYYLDRARRLRAEAFAAMFRKMTGAVARTLHFGPASRGATPRAV